ncbi:O-methyltransferase [Flavobacterium hydrophilum]|uniref:Methyltransferase n=1 Tax=Flavobacterium hydrophilum TaxID=2211445 RepID=A0A2V4C0B2_9FLAO|nr:O-methyltransferase [Flavobacterium hydrophilum]PXY44726.1 hypothetical protein DMB68_14830 [Flavobacterium hydrophilum]
MSASGNSINYDLRTAKSVERRMISSVVKELFSKVNHNKRRYIGMGSTYFTDFKLFHKELHIKNMISIEIEQRLQKRVEFNKPFSCINVEIGKSTDVLPQLNWNKNVDLIWMDYDEKLNYDYFTDIEIIFTNMAKGGVYLMTCNKQLHRYQTVADFEEEFGGLVPLGTHVTDFNGENDFKLIRKMLLNKINEVVQSRNYSLEENEQLIFRQLFYFTYRDGAPMISYGGYLDLKNNAFNLKDYTLDRFDFISTEEIRYVISPPVITNREINLLNSCLPNSEKKYNSFGKIQFIPESDRESFRKLYKFLPTYMDVMY